MCNLVSACLLGAIVCLNVIGCLAFPFLSDEYDSTVDKRLAGTEFQCPPHMDRKACFDAYIKAYVKVARHKAGKGRQLLGKRDGKRLGFECSPDMTQLECYDHALAYYLKIMKYMNFYS